MYGKHKGDLGTLAKATGSSEKLLKAKPPKDAGDFATNLLNGAYSQEWTSTTEDEDDIFM